MSNPDDKDRVSEQVERIMLTLKRQDAQYGGSANIREYEVACVLKAMADHTLIMGMLAHRPDPTSPWPEATSIGRWFHDAADSIFDEQ